MMENLAINSLLPADAAATQTADADALPEDGKSFLDALSGLMGKRTGEAGQQEAAESDPLADVQPEQTQGSSDPASGMAFMLISLEPALAKAPSGELIEQAMDYAIHAGGLELPGSPVSIDATEKQLRVAGKAGEHEALSLDTDRMSAEPAPADARQFSRASLANSQSAIQEPRSTDLQPAREFGTQSTATAFPGMANQLGAAFQVGAPQPPATDIPSANLIAPRVGASGWPEAMGQKIVMMASEHVQQAEIRLNPEGLGPLQVVLSLEKGAADVQFLSHDAHVREALQAALPKLQEMLTSAGFSLDRVSIDSGAAKDQGARGNTEQFQQQRRESGRGDAETASMPVTRVVVQNRPGRIDTFA